MNQPPRASIIARSPKGNALVSFDNEAAAKRWFDDIEPKPNVTFHRQTIIEEEIKL